MQVLNHEHLRPPLGGPDQQASQSVEGLTAPLGWAHGPHGGVAGVDGQQSAQIRRDGARILTDFRHAALDLGGDRRVGVALLDAEPAPEQVHQRMECHGAAEREAVTLLPGRFVTDPPAQLEEQARLADARIADDERHLAAVRPGAVEGVEK